MRKLIHGMSEPQDDHIAAAGDDIGQDGPLSEELFQWWLEFPQVGEGPVAVRLVTGDAIAEITRQGRGRRPDEHRRRKLAGAGMRAGLID